MKNLQAENPYYCFCHGDIHRGNVFFCDTTPRIFDFDCMGKGYRMYWYHDGYFNYQIGIYKFYYHRWKKENSVKKE